MIDEIIKPSLEFIKGIKPRDKVAIVHGHDNDSICSAAIIYKLLKNLHKIESSLIASGLNFAITESVLENTKKIRPNHIIVVDISEVNVEILTELRNISRVMIIDHHKPKGYVKVTYVNPRVFNKDIYLPATYLCYKIYEKFLDPKEVLWVAGIGTLSDMGMKNCNDLFTSIKREYRELVGDNLNVDETLFDNSLLGKLAKIFDSARVVNDIEGSKAALNSIIRLNNFNDVLTGSEKETKQLLEWYNLVEKEFNRLVKDFEKRGKVVRGLVLYEIKSKYKMKSSLAGYLSKNMEREILVIYQKSGKYIDVSFRRGKMSFVDLNVLAERSVEKIPDSSGGGHPPASGARFPAKYLNKFLTDLKKTSKDS